LQWHEWLLVHGDIIMRLLSLRSALVCVALVAEGACAWAGAGKATYLFTELGTLGGHDGGGTAINNAGTVIGESTTPNQSLRPTMWVGDEVIDLGTLGGSSSDAFAINKTGAVVGEACLPDGWSCHAALWMNDTVTNLGTLPGGARSTAYAINDAGQIVGNSEKAGAGRTATLWNGTTATDLGTLGGSGSTAYGINNAGTIVGAAYGFRARYSSLRATLWNGDGIVDLNALIDPAAKKAGWILVEARAITDRGQITGYARNKETKATCAFLLTPLR
jgi:probable HAF family extracellular repeat protein